MTRPRSEPAREVGLGRLVPAHAPAFVRRFVLSEIFGPPLGRLPGLQGRRPPGATAGEPRPAAAPPADPPPEGGRP